MAGWVGIAKAFRGLRRPRHAWRGSRARTRDRRRLADKARQGTSAGRTRWRPGNQAMHALHAAGGPPVATARTHKERQPYHLVISPHKSRKVLVGRHAPMKHLGLVVAEQEARGVGLVEIHVVQSVSRSGHGHGVAVEPNAEAVSTAMRWAMAEACRGPGQGGAAGLCESEGQEAGAGSLARPRRPPRHSTRCTSRAKG